MSERSSGPNIDKINNKLKLLLVLLDGVALILPVLPDDVENDVDNDNCPAPS